MSKMQKLPKVSKWSSLALLFETIAFLEQDQIVSPLEVHRRDRGIGRQYEQNAGRSLRSDTAIRKISNWLAARIATAGSNIGPRILGAERVLGFALGVLGALLGASTAATVFWYDGQRPVNVLMVLFVYVFLPSLFLLFSLLAMLPRWLTGAIPGVRGLLDLVQCVAPGRLYRQLARILPQHLRNELEQLRALTSRRQTLFHSIEQWLVLTATQFFAIGFFVGSLFYAVFLVVVHDVAFAWSTTLAVGANSFEQLVQVIAGPWKWFAPDAVPTLGLIEDTRYFRWEHVSKSPMQAIEIMKFGGWWPFIVLCIAVYGALPRVALALYSRRQLERSARELLLSYPGVLSLLERLDTDPIQSTAQTPEHSRTFEDVSGATSTRIPTLVVTPGLFAVDWARSGVERWKVYTTMTASSAADSSLKSEVPLGVIPAPELFADRFVAAGASTDISEDEAALNLLRAWVPKAVAIFVKAWEPPTEESIDFFKAVRAVIGERKSIYIVALASSESAPELTLNVELEQLGVWSRRILRMSDPWTELRVLDAIRPGGEG